LRAFKRPSQYLAANFGWWLSEVLKRKIDDRPLTWHDLWFLEAAISLTIIGTIYVLIGQFFSVLTQYIGLGLIFSLIGLPIVITGLYLVWYERRLGRRPSIAERVSNIENLSADQRDSRRWDQWIKLQYGKKTTPLNVFKKYKPKSK
jgi:hypothetical protein